MRRSVIEEDGSYCITIGKKEILEAFEDRAHKFMNVGDRIFGVHFGEKDVALLVAPKRSK